MNAPDLNEAAGQQQDRLSQAQDKIAHQRLVEAFKARNLQHAQPANVLYKDREGETFMIYDDGSLRKQQRKNPALSGRQFRKGMKSLRREIKAKRRQANNAQVAASMAADITSATEDSE
jgi:hypothetical protein